MCDIFKISSIIILKILKASLPRILYYAVLLIIFKYSYLIIYLGKTKTFQNFRGIG